MSATLFFDSTADTRVSGMPLQRVSKCSCCLVTLALTCASVQSPLAPGRPALTSGQCDSAYLTAQVKDLEMQQDGIQRAIETKQQQLKPLEAEVRGRSRQATKTPAQRFLPLGFKIKAPEYIGRR